jgi:hypothetical protein
VAYNDAQREQKSDNPYRTRLSQRLSASIGWASVVERAAGLASRKKGRFVLFPVFDRKTEEASTVAKDKRLAGFRKPPVVVNQ